MVTHTAQAVPRLCVSLAAGASEMVVSNSADSPRTSLAECAWVNGRGQKGLS